MPLLDSLLCSLHSKGLIVDSSQELVSPSGEVYVRMGKPSLPLLPSYSPVLNLIASTLQFPPATVSDPTPMPQPKVSTSPSLPLNPSRLFPSLLLVLPMSSSVKRRLKNKLLSTVLVVITTLFTLSLRLERGEQASCFCVECYSQLTFTRSSL